MKHIKQFESRDTPSWEDMKKLHDEWEDTKIHPHESSVDFSDIEDYFRELIDIEYGVVIKVEIDKYPSTRDEEDLQDDVEYSRYLNHILRIEVKNNIINRTRGGNLTASFDHWKKITNINSIILKCLEQLSSQKDIEIGSINIDGNKLTIILGEKVS